MVLLAAVMLAAPKEPDVPAPPAVWKRLGPPREDEWRWRYHEEGQTLAEYKAAAPVRATDTRRTIYLQPFLTRPPRDRAMLGRIATVLGAFFGAGVKELPPRPLPERAYHRARRQIDIRRIVHDLLQRLPDDALFVLAVTDRDLFAGRLDHLFGWGSLDRRVGIMSYARVATGADEARWRARTVALAAHEAGHMLSLPHCVFFGCLMNGSRTTEEADRRPMVLCPVCREKLCWNRGLDVAERYRALAGAFERAGLAGAAAEVRRAAVATSEQSKG